MATTNSTCKVLHRRLELVVNVTTARFGSTRASHGSLCEKQIGGHRHQTLVKFF